MSNLTHLRDLAALLRPKDEPRVITKEEAIFRVEVLLVELKNQIARTINENGTIDKMLRDSGIESKDLILNPLREAFNVFSNSMKDAQDTLLTEARDENN